MVVGIQCQDHYIRPQECQEFHLHQASVHIVIGTIQKKILNELAKGERSSNGFIDRILFVMPNLQQKARWNDKELPENIEQEWNGIIGKLIQQEYALNEFGEIEPQILLFTEDAKDGFTNGNTISLSYATGKQTTPS